MILFGTTYRYKLFVLSDSSGSIPALNSTLTFKSRILRIRDRAIVDKNKEHSRSLDKRSAIRDSGRTQKKKPYFLKFEFPRGLKTFHARAVIQPEPEFSGSGFGLLQSLSEALGTGLNKELNNNSSLGSLRWEDDK